MNKLIKLCLILFITVVLVACDTGGSSSCDGDGELITLSLDVPSSVKSGESAVFNANIAQSGEEDIDYLWSAAASCGSFDDTYAASPVFTASNTADDIYCAVSLSISGAGTASHSVNIIVTGTDSAPVFSVSLTVPGALTPGSRTTLRPSVTYTGPDSISYAWSVPAGCGAFDNTSAQQPVFTADSAWTGPCIISLTVAAGSLTRSASAGTIIGGGGVLSGDIAVSIMPPAAVASGTMATLAADVTYEGLALESYMWSVPMNCGSLNDNMAQSPVFTAANASVNKECPVTLTITAGAESTQASGSMTVTAPGYDAMLSAVMDIPASVAAGETAVFDASVTYTGTDTPRYSWMVSSGCGTLSSDSVRSPVFTAAAEAGGDTACTVSFTVTTADRNAMDSAGFMLTP